MRQKIPIVIHLEGKGVEDGSVLIEDLVPALQGFSSAYGKVASSYTQNLNHKIRVESFKPGSFTVHLYTTVMDNKESIAVASEILSGSAIIGAVAYKAVDYVIQLIKIKKHVKNLPFNQQINYHNSTVVVVNADNLELSIPLEIYNLMKDKSIDADLNKLASIVDDENIENINISYERGEEVIAENINVKDKKYFDIDNQVVSETQNTWITCKINSLTKSTNRGYAYLSDSSRVGFKLVTETPNNLYKHFAHNGWVKMFCKAKLDENLKPIELDVYDIQAIDVELPFDEMKADNSDIL